MAEQENCVRLTKAAKMRAVALSSEVEQPQTKKRVVLGELKNLSNTSVSTEEKPSKPKAKATKTKPPVPNKTTPEVNDNEKEKDVDAESVDPQMCGPYVSEIYEYLHKMEVNLKRRPKADYIEVVQRDITPNRRGVLVDWLVKVVEEYKLVSDTLYLTVNYIDRFLSLNCLNGQKLHLLGVSAMLIALKYEGINTRNVEDFCYITENTCTRDEVVKMESDILNSLKFELGNPTIKTFLGRFTRIALDDFKGVSLQLDFLGCYLAELSLLDYRFVKFLPSMIAASVIFLARYMLRSKENPWNLSLQQYCGYKPSDLRACVLMLHDLYLSRTAKGLHAVREKYKQHKFKFVAMTPSPPGVQASAFEDL